MNSTAFAESARQKKIACLLSALDRMKNEVGTTDEALHEFVSGMSAADWAALTDDANAHCHHGIKHTPPSMEARMHVLDALYSRLPNRDAHRDHQRALAARLRRANITVLK